MTEQIEGLQDMEKMSKHEQARADKWSTYYHILEMEHSKVLKESNSNSKREDRAKSQINEMAQAIEEAAQKAQRDAEEIKELQEINKILITKHQENKKDL